MQNVTVTNVDIPFFRVVAIIFKWTLASFVVSAIFAIPAFVLWTVLVLLLLA